MSSPHAASVTGIGAVTLLLAGLLAISAQIWAKSPGDNSGVRFGTRAEKVLEVDLNALPATAAGIPESKGAESDIGGKRLVGQVRNLYVRVAHDVLLDASQVPKHMITGDTIYFADVEFPELLPNGAEALRAQLFDMSDVQRGDIVEIKVAHKHNPEYFPVREVPRVTKFVAGADTQLARDFARRITLARLGLSPLQAMLQTRSATASVSQ